MKEFVKTDLFIYIIRPIIYMGIAYIIYKLLSLLTSKTMNNTKKLSVKNRKRIKTSLLVINNCIKYIIFLITILIILSSVGIDVSKIFAGLGIIAAVLTLAFQDLAKDFIAGISIILENQFEIGDNVSINGFRGEVINMGLKTTRIKNYNGSVKIISNHSINEIINYSLNPSLAEVDILIDYQNDLDKVDKVITKTLATIDETYKNLKGKSELWGIDKISETALLYKIVVKTLPNQNFDVERKMRKDIQKALLKANIKLPKTHMEVYNGE